ncbi:MAG: ribosome maturation factor RimP [bacterium]|nr:ribosome maturation factor RimP [bacterium]
MSLTELQYEQLETLILPLLEAKGFDLVDMELGSQGKTQIFSLLVDKPGGILIDDCAEISRMISPLLDVEDPFPFEYQLEVGSPGLFRVLKKDKDLLRHQQERVKVKLITPIEGNNQLIGRLEGFDDRQVSITLESDQRTLNLERENIKKLSLEPKLF